MSQILFRNKENFAFVAGTTYKKFSVVNKQNPPWPFGLLCISLLTSLSRLPVVPATRCTSCLVNSDMHVATIPCGIY